MSKEFGDVELYWVDDTDPLIKAAALWAVLDLNGDEREENQFLAGPVFSVRFRTEESPGTVFMGEEDGPVVAPMTVL